MKTVLLIKNHRALRENLTELLEMEGFKVIAEEDGREGMHKALNLRPDIIVCGELNGAPVSQSDVLLFVRKNSEIKNIPFISLISHFEPMLKQDGDVAIAADSYLRKPFQEKELLELIEQHLHNIEE